MTYSGARIRVAAVLGIALPAMAAPGIVTPEAIAGTEIESSVLAPLAAESLMLDGASAGGRLVAVGERGHILVSDDQGARWRQVPAPTRAMLTGVFFLGRDLGWAVGHDAVILRTRDGAEHWDRVHYAPEEERPLLDVWFRDAEHGFAIGAYGFFLATEDGGATWRPREITVDDGAADDYAYGGASGDLHLNQISRASSGRLYIAAEAGTIYRSDDGGTTWVSLPSPYEGSYFATLCLEDDALLVFGLRGHVYRSENAGNSWEPLETATMALLSDGARLDDGTVVITGLGGTLLVSEDGGRSLMLVQRADRLGISAVLQTDDRHLILIGEGGVRRISESELFEAEAP